MTREEILVDVASDVALGVPELVDRFLRPPVHRSTAASTWGTVYTAAYDSDHRTLELSWPDERWTLTLAAFEESVHTRRSLVAVPAPVYEPPTDHVPQHPPVLIA